MIGTTHSTVGALVGAIVGQQTGNWWVGAAVGAFGGLLPDIDDPNTTVGHVLPFFSYPLNKLFGHRSYTHTLWFAVIMGILTKWLSTSYIVPYLHSFMFKELFMSVTVNTIVLPLVMGIMTHLALDSTTQTGIYPLLPIKWQLRGPVVTGSYTDYAIAMGCSLILVGWIGITFLK